LAILRRTPLTPAVLLLAILTGCAAPLEVGVLLEAQDEVVLTTRTHRDYFIADVDLGDGVLRPFLVDTGASICVVDSRLLEHTLGRTITDGDVYRLPHLSAGPINARNVPSLAHDMTRIAAALDYPVDGVIGFPLFRDVLLEFDYPEGELRIRRGALPVADGYWVLRLRGDHICPYVDVKILGDKVPVLIDTGSDSGIGLTELHPGHVSAPPKPTTPVITVRGREARVAARLNFDIRIGPITLRRPLVYKRDPARVGSRILRHCVVTFDQVNKRVRLLSRRNILDE